MNNKEIIEITRYLIGDSKQIINDRLWNKSARKTYPAISPLLSTYLKEVNRFLFSGGITFDIQNGLEDDPRQTYINSLIKYWKLAPKLESIWVSGATYGDLGVVIKPQGNLFKLEWFPSTQVSIKEDKIIVLSPREIKGKQYVYRLDITDQEYIEYPLVPASMQNNFDWASAASGTPHGYGEKPFVLLKNKEDVFSDRGIPEFDCSALDLAISHLMVLYDGIENVHYFGHPWFASPDPDDTLARLQKRIQVLQKDPAEDGGSPEILEANSITDEHLSLMDRLESYFRSYTGLSSAYHELPAQISNVALKTLNSATIDLAETRWLNYVDEGLIPVLTKCLKFSGLPLVRVDNPETYMISAHRNKPYFAESVADRVQQLTIAEALVNIGMDRAHALRETFYPNLTTEQIREKLNPNLGDF
jgi:hypothetical protein